MISRINQAHEVIEDEPRNDFERLENHIVQKIFSLLANNVKAKQEIGNLILHYQQEIDRLEMEIRFSGDHYPLA